MIKLYEQINIYGHTESSIKVYRCFRCLLTNKFYVQSCDNFYEPFDQKQVEQSIKGLLELFAEESVEKRISGFDTIQEAILNFDEGFLSDDG